MKLDAADELQKVFFFFMSCMSE